MSDSTQTLYRLRKCIGILGMLLPILIAVFHSKSLASISHYYYTSSGIFFIGILFAFGLLLLSYRGHNPEPGEILSDDTMTTLAGLFILIAVVIPTSCCDSGDALLQCDPEAKYLFGHTNKFQSGVHLISAALFLLILGWMCVYKFTRSKTDAGKKYHKLYRICGYTVWASVGVIAVLFAIDEFTSTDIDKLVPGYTFILETVALYAFAIAWLVKGDVKEDWIALKERLFK